MIKKNEEVDSLGYTRWNCKYHIVFASKYRGQMIYNQIKADIGNILRRLCEYKEIEIIEGEACPDHIVMLVSIPPKYSLSQVMGYLFRCSSTRVFTNNGSQFRTVGFHLFGTAASPHRNNKIT